MSGLRVVDTFCGAGGFSEGFRQAGFDVVYCIDNWKPARDTHAQNGFDIVSNHDMLELVGDDGWNNAKKLAKEIEATCGGNIDVLIGSPPCTEFSFSKKGGKGDRKKGMLLVQAHLKLAAALRPTFWLMENVPRLNGDLATESAAYDERGWCIPLENLGIDERIKGLPWIDEQYLYVPYGAVYDASEYGAPQKRMRFIAGNVPPELILSLSKLPEPPTTMKTVLEALDSKAISKKETIQDPNYPHHTIRRENLRDHDYDTKLHPLYWEELRHLKKRHIQYGRMTLPDDTDKPARTVMATFNPSSRESIVIDPKARARRYHGKLRPVYRQPTVREVACLQGFPLDYQLVAGSLSGRYKLVGNAVPCQLAYTLACAVLKAFGEEGFTFGDTRQQARFQTTNRRRMRNGYRPRISSTPSEMIIPEASDIHKKHLDRFRARKNKHIRRKLLSSKPQRGMSMVVFENTRWSIDGLRDGGPWRSCVQQGVGKCFSQIYLDEVCVRELRLAVDSDRKLSDKIPELKGLLFRIIQDIDAGIPLVSSDWEEFPGYSGQEAEKYIGMIPTERKRLPSIKVLQRLLTQNVKVIEDIVSPIDLFDGLDAIMLRNLSEEGVSWVLKQRVRIEHLTDLGEDFYNGRISKCAKGTFSGQLPLLTVITALASVHVLYRMYEQEADMDDEDIPWMDTLTEAWKGIQEWTRDIDCNNKA